jgi:hypothetical protein
MIHFLVPREGDFTIREHLDSWGRSLARRMSILHYEEMPAWQELPEGTYVLSALDQLTPAGRRLLGELCDQLQANSGVRVLNSPRTTLLRLELLEELHRQGFNRHRAARADEDLAGLRFPVFLREEHRHTGALTPLLETSGELQAALGQAIVRGHRLKNLLVIEFSDCADREGFFRKYAAFAVGSEIVPKSLAHGRSWMLKHAEAEFTPSMIQEEQTYVLENPHEQQLRRIFAVARVDYGRIDYSVKDGLVQTWEINLNPVIGAGPRSSSRPIPIPAELKLLRQAAKEHFYRRFQAAFEAIDVGGEASRRIPIRYSPESLRQLRAMTRDEHSSGRMAAVRKVLRPVRPLIDRIAGAVSPILIKVARRVG